MKRRAATGASEEIDESPEGAGTAPARGAADRPLAVPSAADAEDSELEEPLPDAERLVDEAVAQCGEDLDTARLVRRYWRFAPDEQLVGLSAAELVQAAREHRELARQRLPGELKLQVDDTADGELTRIMVVTDDMPFLVDTVTAALASRDLSVHLLVHPLMVVRRQPLGALVEVAADVEPDDAIAGDIIESWTLLHVDRVREPVLREELLHDLRRVLTDVREAVEDWPKMRAQALGLADELTAASLPVPDRDITDSVELLRWLVDDHFTFLGYREYRLIDGQMLQAFLGTGLGILRGDQTQPPRLVTLTTEAYGWALD